MVGETHSLNFTRMSLGQQPKLFDVVACHKVNNHAMAINIKLLNRLINEANEDEDTTQEFDEFSTLDLRMASCFGYSTPFKKSWVYMANESL